MANTLALSYKQIAQKDEHCSLFLEWEGHFDALTDGAVVSDVPKGIYTDFTLTGKIEFPNTAPGTFKFSVYSRDLFTPGQYDAIIPNNPVRY